MWVVIALTSNSSRAMPLRPHMFSFMHSYGSIDKIETASDTFEPWNKRWITLQHNSSKAEELLNRVCRRYVSHAHIPLVGGSPLGVSSAILLHHARCSWAVNPSTVDGLWLVIVLSLTGHDAMPLLHVFTIVTKKNQVNGTMQHGTQYVSIR